MRQFTLVSLTLNSVFSFFTSSAGGGGASAALGAAAGAGAPADIMGIPADKPNFSFIFVII